MEIYAHPMQNIKIPTLPKEYIKIEFACCNENLVCGEELQNGCPFPLATSEIAFSFIRSIERLSINTDSKDVIQVLLDFEGDTPEYIPGDTVGIIPTNCPQEVEDILSLLGINEKIDQKCIVSVINSKEEGSQIGKFKSLPPHLPECSTLRKIFETCVEVRGPPKKLFLRSLAEYASNETEKNCLLMLCSREGRTEYERLFSPTAGESTPGFGLLHLLKAFPSCSPPVSVVLQHLPRLKARPYSISSSPLAEKGIRIIFSVYSKDSRKGVCTAWLEKFLPSSSLEEQLKSLSVNSTLPVVPLFFRKSCGFCLSGDLSVPFILIGPGTGVAPFIGFLEHLEEMKRADKALVCGEVWLFYGCRNPDKDYFCEKFLNKFIENGTLSKLYLSFSRFSGTYNNWNGSKYVQDSMKAIGEKFVNQLLDKGANLYISGDAKNMFKDVKETINSLIQKYREVDTHEASNVLKNLIARKKYLEDVWT